MANLSKLNPAIEKVEFKHTVLASKERHVQHLLRSARVTPRRRKVYFYDTPGRDLYKQGLVLRGRVTDGDDDDSTVKIRPVSLRRIPAGWKKAGVRIELDVVGAEQIRSAKLDSTPKRGRIERGRLSKLFSEEQRALVKRRANGTKLGDLAVFGPVDARKWEIPPAHFPHELAVEEWSLPDGTRFFELSFKVEPDEAAKAKREFDELLDYLKIGRKGDPDPKTPKVLEFFAARL
jgi:hypothetical protein